MGLGSPKRYDIAPHIRVSFAFTSYLTENTSLHVLLYENINLGQKRNVLKFSSPFLASLYYLNYKRIEFFSERHEHSYG